MACEECPLGSKCEFPDCEDYEEYRDECLYKTPTEEEILSFVNGILLIAMITMLVMGVRVTCVVCKGSGTLWTGKKLVRCDYCNGKGYT